jgi:uncharacterized membrane protein YeiH
MLITVLDITGAFVFAITGCFKAMKHELDILRLVFLVLMTGIVGGIVRDVLVSGVSEVLKSGFYASASTLGALLYFAIFRLPFFRDYPTLFMVVTVIAIVAVRIVALKMNFHLTQLH